MKAWKCEKGKEIDHRPDGEGFTFRYQCKRNSNQGDARAIFNPTDCTLAYLETMPSGKGIGKAVSPLLEKDMLKKGCKVVKATVKTSAGYKYLVSQGYKITKGEFRKNHPLGWIFVDEMKKKLSVKESFKRFKIDRATFERLVQDQEEAGRIMHEWVIDPKTAGEGWVKRKDQTHNRSYPQSL